jgi:hypothetical protein
MIKRVTDDWLNKRVLYHNILGTDLQVGEACKELILLRRVERTISAVAEHCDGEKAEFAKELMEFINKAVAICR